MERGGSAMERLQECGCGYVEFALRWPQHFLVMFDLPRPAQGHEKHKAAGHNAYAVLLECTTALGDHPKAAIDDQVKSGHREKA